MRHYQHHIGDFDKATRHLTRVERSIYRDMIELYYDKEGQLPLDVAVICRKVIARTNEEATAVQQVLNEFFNETPTGWYHQRCEEEIEVYHSNTGQKSIAGRASAAARALKKQQALNGCSTDVATGVEIPLNGNPTNRKPKTVNLEPNINPLSDKPDKLGPIDDVFDYWQRAMKSPRSKLDAKRKGSIKKSLALGYTVEQLKTAIKGCRMTPHNMGQNERGTVFNGIDLIFKCADNIDRFISTATNGVQNGQTGKSGNGDTNRPTSAAGRVRENVARERAQFAAVAAGSNAVGVVIDGEFVRA